VEALDVQNLRKVYGTTVALDGVSFAVEPGEVFGIIGPNGSGKTTTLRILGTLIKPTSGSASVFGHDVVAEAEAVRTMIGYLPEEAGVYVNLTGYEYLRFIGSLYPAVRGNLESVVKEGVAISGLGDRLGDKSGGYSMGMKRRLS
jgi:ABC-2 type transport system ATP-binding protein